MPEVEETMSIVLTGQMEIAAAQATLNLRQLILNMRASGATDAAIRTTLLTDLNEGGRIFGGFKNAIKGNVKNGVSFASRAGSREVYEEADVREFEWVLTKENNCPDCLERAGRRETWEMWETIGLPQSGFSICQDNCGCILEGVK